MRRPIYLLIYGALLLAACSTHYQIASITRTRILIDSTYDADDPMLTAFMQPYKHEVDSIMSPVVGRTARYLSADRPESSLSNLLPDILVWAAQKYGEEPAFGVYNMGGIRAAFAQGDVTYGDVLEVAPFENKICFLSLTGEKVMELFSQIASTHGEGLSHGVRLIITPEGKLLEASLNGQEINRDSTYRVVTIDYVAQGNDYMTAFKDKTDYTEFTDSLSNVRFIIMDYFRDKAARGEAVDAQEEGRILVKTPY